MQSIVHAKPGLRVLVDAPDPEIDFSAQARISIYVSDPHLDKLVVEDIYKLRNLEAAKEVFDRGDSFRSTR